VAIRVWWRPLASIARLITEDGNGDGGVSADAGSPRALGALFVAISGLSFGSLSVFTRHLAAAGVSVPMMLCLRFAVGAVVAFALAAARGQLVALPLRRWLGFALLGALYVCEAWTYFESAVRIPVALTALLLYLYPSIVALAGWALFREALGTTGLAALVLATAGIALAVGTPQGALDIPGVLLGLATAVVYSVYVVVGARVQAGVPALLGSAWVMAVAAALFALGTLVTGTWEPARALSHWPDLAGLVVFGTALPIPLLLAGLARVGPTQGSIISSLEPISAAVCGALFLGESLDATQLVGMGLVLLALVVLARRGS
jgi:drug/metabolite transporter (DMT)-like permease